MTVTDLVWLGGGEPPRWQSGNTHRVASTVHAVADFLERRKYSVAEPDWLLFWDSSLVSPDESRILQLLSTGTPADMFHAGLGLGTSGKPGIEDFVLPTWMYCRDPAANIPATSWRASLRACLLRPVVIEHCGGLDRGFESLDAAALELGYRYLRAGVIVRHEPSLLPQGIAEQPIQITIRDELLFALRGFGAKWARWALFRALLTGYRPRRGLLEAWRGAGGAVPAPACRPFSRPHPPERGVAPGSVTVLIPTLERYPYLEALLAQLRGQTRRPEQIILIDQTPESDRDRYLERRNADLPLEVIEMSEPGQCASRNAGLQKATGDWILFLDDDVKIPGDLVERHLKSCDRFGAHASSGVADEAGVEKLTPEFGHAQASSVFPAGNTLLRKSWLRASGLFDLAYDRGQRADADLGMRLYLAGALLVLDPAIRVFHHRAPRGGLRVHKARVVTYATSREKLTHRHLPAVSEIYLALRYFSERQVREALLLRILGTYSGKGSRIRKSLKILISTFLLPDTVTRVVRRYSEACRMLGPYPRIPDASWPEGGPERPHGKGRRWNGIE